MVRLRISDRLVAARTYYVFFAFGGAYSKRYTTIKAENIMLAKMQAIKEYGLVNFGSVAQDGDAAKAKVKSYGFEEIAVRDGGNA